MLPSSFIINWHEFQLSWLFCLAAKAGKMIKKEQNETVSQLSCQLLLIEERKRSVILLHTACNVDEQGTKIHPATVL